MEIIVSNVEACGQRPWCKVAAHGAFEQVDRVSDPRDQDALAREQELVRRAQAGDRDALRELLELHSEALFGQVILPRTGDRAAAEDILKATMVTAIEKLPGFTWQGRSMYHWLRRIAHNRVIDHHRRTQRTRKMASALASEPAADVLPGRSPDAEQALIAAEERRLNLARASAAMERINPRYQEAIRLRLLQELPRERCAEQLGVSVSTFDVVLFRALKALRKQFGMEK